MKFVKILTQNSATNKGDSYTHIRADQIAQVVAASEVDRTNGRKDTHSFVYLIGGAISFASPENPNLLIEKIQDALL